MAVSSPSQYKRGVISISGSGHYVTFDGAKITFQGTGEFTAFASRRLDVSIQVRQVQQGGSVRLRCAAVQVGSNVLSIHSSIGIVSNLIVMIDDKQVSSRETKL